MNIHICNGTHIKTDTRWHNVSDTLLRPYTAIKYLYQADFRAVVNIQNETTLV